MFFFFSKINSCNNKSIKFISSLHAVCELVERQKIPPVCTLPSQKLYITSLTFFNLFCVKGGVTMTASSICLLFAFCFIWLLGFKQNDQSKYSKIQIMSRQGSSPDPFLVTKTPGNGLDLNIHFSCCLKPVSFLTLCYRSWILGIPAWHAKFFPCIL